MTSPCYRCPVRHFRCHTACQQYDGYRADLDLQAAVHELNKAAAPWHLAVERKIDRRRRKTQVRNAGRP